MQHHAQAFLLDYLQLRKEHFLKREVYCNKQTINHNEAIPRQVNGDAQC